MEQYASVIIDISHEKVDRIFQYVIPPEWRDQVKVGCQVYIPFGQGNSRRTGYVVDITDHADYDLHKLKAIAGVVTGSVSVQSQLIQLAWWMKERFGSTMNQSLKTVLPVKQEVRAVETRTLCCLLGEEELKKALDEARRRRYSARVRLLEAFLTEKELSYERAVKEMKLSPASLKQLEEKGILKTERSRTYRNPVLAAALDAAGSEGESETRQPALNREQQEITDDFFRRYDGGDRTPSLIYGVTGSGKTLVYMELIDHVRRQGKQVIVLIPEIALTYQTVLRFYRRFGDRVSIINSRLSAGERYDQLQRAGRGEIDIMIGPRSALFTPFSNLGLVVIDEEHEGAYKSEVAPRYHARDVAEQLCRMNGAALVLGSATPSLESYTRALDGVYRLYTLKERAKKNSRMALTRVVDMREELKAGNKSVFSRMLYEEMASCLEQKQQMMLFLNRRGYSSFLSCRSCGQAVRCPHCDVTLTLHRKERLLCHYCGYQIPVPKQCPSCGSPYIAAFGTGTQKVESLTRQAFPDARILRMDLDTTSGKNGHQEILRAFADGRADILIGTQMIVKGHDFPNVTLVGVLAADLSLYASDYRSAERTFQLLTQAVGRAGRDDRPGRAVIQTYSPEHYSIATAAAQDYPEFYRREMAYRRLMQYPPVCSLLTVQLSSGSEENLGAAAEKLAVCAAGLGRETGAAVIGPAEASVYKVNDIYRKILYMKHENYDILIKIQGQLEQFLETQECFREVMVQYDYS